jgi:hypothetical protein
MPTYLITYHGGSGMPESPEAQQQVHAAFQAWAAGVGDALVDPGAPLGESRTVSADAVVDGSVAPIGGYTLLRAADLEAAVDLVRDHPFVARGGALQVDEAIALGG